MKLCCTFVLHFHFLICFNTLFDISPRENKAMAYILNVFININWNSVLSVQDIRKLKTRDAKTNRVSKLQITAYQYS